MALTMPTYGWRIATALMVLGSLGCTAIFFIGWLKMPKKSYTLFEYNLMGAGLFLFATGLTVYSGAVSIPLISSLDVLGYGYWAPPLGTMLFLAGMLIPCKINLALENEGLK